MDVAYNQHARRNGRSSSNLNHLTLAPLTSRLPINQDDLSDPHVSYYEGRSAPTTPSVLSRSSSRVSIRKPLNLDMLKSKSTTQLLHNVPKHRSGSTTPGGTKLRRGTTREDLSLSSLSAKDRSDSDWLLRAGATISSSTRESKGQAWLVTRSSSTSLTGQLDEEEQALHQELVREKEQASRAASRRGSIAWAFDADDEFSPVTTRNSAPGSRFGSRVASRRGSKAQAMTPFDGLEREDYFESQHYDPEALLTEPDFVDAEDETNKDMDNEKEDEAVVQRLARASNMGLTGWLEHLIGWSLFSVDDDGEENEVDEKAEDSEVSSKTSRKTTDVNEGLPTPTPLPPIKDGEVGTWNDAAWLLSVATKVIF